MKEGLADEFQAVQRPYRGQDVRRIGALPAPGFEQGACFEQIKHPFKEQFFGTTVKQTCSKVTQEREVKPWIIEFEAEGVFPVNASPDGIGSSCWRSP